jgi:1-deoxy-D-xylulose-5-phosphate synthase
VFSRTIVELGKLNDDVVAITAAMQGPTGLDAFARKFPERTFDVGIAEQHATTSAAGLAYAGMHPVVAMYSTFLNRAFDQIVMDCALHKAGVTFVLDRAGVTGDDGPSHNGMWDLAMLQPVPDVRIAAPRDGVRLGELLTEAISVRHAPTVVRFPKGALPVALEPVTRLGDMDVLLTQPNATVLIVSIGAMAGLAMDAARQLSAEGIAVTVIDPRWVKPLPTELVDAARDVDQVITIEDGVRIGGVGSVFAQQLSDAGITTPVTNIGLPSEFLAHGKRAEVLAAVGLTSQSVVAAVSRQRLASS